MTIALDKAFSWLTLFLPRTACGSTSRCWAFDTITPATVSLTSSLCSDWPHSSNQDTQHWIRSLAPAVSTLMDKIFIYIILTKLVLVAVFKNISFFKDASQYYDNMKPSIAHWEESQPQFVGKPPYVWEETTKTWTWTQTNLTGERLLCHYAATEWIIERLQHYVTSVRFQPYHGLSHRGILNKTGLLIICQ